MFFYIKSKYENDNRFVEFWENIKDGFLETKWLLPKISGNKEPMENYSYDKASRAIREQLESKLYSQCRLFSNMLRRKSMELKIIIKETRNCPMLMKNKFCVHCLGIRMLA